MPARCLQVVWPITVRYGLYPKFSSRFYAMAPGVVRRGIGRWLCDSMWVIIYIIDSKRYSLCVCSNVNSSKTIWPIIFIFGKVVWSKQDQRSSSWSWDFSINFQDMIHKWYTNSRQSYSVNNQIYPVKKIISPRQRTNFLTSLCF